MIRITTKLDGFRRASMPHFGVREYPDGTFTAEDLAALKAEPMLVVEEILESKKPKGPAAEPPEAEEKKG